MGDNTVVTFMDLLHNESFRRFVEQRLANHSINQDYCFPDHFPSLYKYRSLSDYTIDDIMKQSITMSPITFFNDLYDSAIHFLGNEKEIEEKTIREWKKVNPLLSEDSPLNEEYYKRIYGDYYREDSRRKFWLTDFVGSLVCCFSESDSSILMWSHYADSNQGICIEYDFNNLKNKNQKNGLFPVCYSQVPVTVEDLLFDEERKITEYPADSALLCSMLNKADVWSYEKEWRMIIIAGTELKKKRAPCTIGIVPNKIILGNCFLKKFFYDDYSKAETYQENINRIIRLLDFCKSHSIQTAYMRHSTGKFCLKPVLVETDKLLSFIYQNFNHGEPLNMRYYHVVQDHFLELIDKERSNA